MTYTNDVARLSAQPDRLAIDPRSPHRVAAVIERNIGIRWNDIERSGVEENYSRESLSNVAFGNSGERRPLDQKRSPTNHGDDQLSREFSRPHAHE